MKRVYLLFLSCTLIFCVRSTIKELAPEETWQQLAVIHGWDLGLIKSVQTFDMELPVQDNTRHILNFQQTEVNNDFDITDGPPETLKNIPVTLYITKEVSKDPTRSSWTITRYVKAFDMSTPIGRISTKKNSTKITCKLTPDGTFSLLRSVADDAKLFNFAPAPDAAGNYTNSSMGFKSYPDYYGQETSSLLIGHLYPAVFNCVTKLAAIGVTKKVRDCSPKFIKSQCLLADCDSPTCTYLGFSPEGVAEQLKRLNQFPVPAMVTCQVNPPVEYHYTTAGIEIANALGKVFGGAQNTDTDNKPGPIYTVPAYSCNTEHQNRACFHNIEIIRNSATPFIYGAPETSESLCPSSQARITCINAYDAGDKKVEYPDNKLSIDATQSRQRRICSVPGQEYPKPWFATCREKINLDVAKPIACSLGNHVTTCALRGYPSLPHFETKSASCAIQDQKAACNFTDLTRMAQMPLLDNPITGKKLGSDVSGLGIADPVSCK